MTLLRFADRCMSVRRMCDRSVRESIASGMRGMPHRCPIGFENPAPLFPSPRPSPSGRGRIIERWPPIPMTCHSPTVWRLLSLSLRERAGVRGNTPAKISARTLKTEMRPLLHAYRALATAFLLLICFCTRAASLEQTQRQFLSGHYDAVIETTRKEVEA